MTRNSLTIVALASLLLACQTPQPEPVDEPAADDALTIRVLSEARVVPRATAVDRQRLIADTLYEALQALDADRLLTPIDDNAHARFMRVLAYDSHNEIALQGLQDIVERYLALSREAMHRGLFEEAATMLDRARFVDADHIDIEDVSVALQEEMNSDDLFFELDNRAFSSRSEQAQAQLADIARTAKQHAAFFLIIAPDDDLARWMFAMMRDAVPGYRLRGNIELASRISIRLRMPTTGN